MPALNVYTYQNNLFVLLLKEKHHNSLFLYTHSFYFMSFTARNLYFNVRAA